MSKILPLAIAGAAAYFFRTQLASALGLSNSAASTENPTAAASSVAAAAAAAGASPTQQAVAAQAAVTANAATAIATAPPPSPMTPSPAFQQAVVQAGYTVTTLLNWYQWDYLFNAAFGYHPPGASNFGIDPTQPLAISAFWGAIYPSLQFEPGSATPSSTPAPGIGRATRRPL